MSYYRVTTNENPPAYRCLQLRTVQDIYCCETTPPITLHHMCVLKLMQRKILFAYPLHAVFLCSALTEFTECKEGQQRNGKKWRLMAYA